MSPSQKILKESYDLLRKSTLNGHQEKASSIINHITLHSVGTHVKMKTKFDLSN